MSFSIKVNSDPISCFKLFNPILNQKAYDNLNKLQSQNIPGEFLYMHEEDGKFFAKNWAPTLVFVNDRFEIRPMRYGLVKRNDQDYKSKKQLTIDITEVSDQSLRGVINIQSYFIMQNQDVTFEIKEFVSSHSINYFSPIIYDNWFSPNREIIIQSFSLLTLKTKSNILSPILMNLEETKSWLNKTPLEIQNMSKSTLTE